MHEVAVEVEKAILVGVVLPKDRRWEVDEYLSELQQLAATAGVEVVDQLVQDRQRLDPATFIGSGKVEELQQMVNAYQAKAVIFDEDLTPAQIRNLEKAIKAKIIDRSTLILDIFAKHARTRTAKTQVELAQLQHLLPRLTRQWTHLSRQVGGIGTKGPGETQLETDRRLIRTRIETLRRELARIDLQRQTRRKGRQESFRASLIGYTNVGKSTIMNLFSGAEVLVEDQLFATLDPTVRQVPLDSTHTILLSDTVGFIRKLPHQLVESFKSTLDEAVEADLLLHVVDVSHPAFHEQIQVVNEVLKEIGAAQKPVLMVFNKIDRLKEKTMLPSLKRQYPQAVFISATRQIRTEKLKQELVRFMEKNFVKTTVKIPLTHAGLVNQIYGMAVVLQQKYTEHEIILTFKSTAVNRDKIRYLVDSASAGNGGCVIC
ncbi:MAG: GTPase HflX [Calditrichae bacterium]|nr:GTPase HflX [Calditrichia bacterium]